MLRASILLTIVAFGYANVLDDVQKMGNMFEKFNDIKSLFATNEKDLKKNVDGVSGLLATLTQKAPLLRPIANEVQKKALDQLGSMSKDVKLFEKKMDDTTESFANKQSTWEKLVTKLFKTENLMSLVSLLNKFNTSNGASVVFSSVVCFVVPSFVLLRQ
ncbi:hypothetical protein AB6A40_001827 [Gnathostoma spinigerum]|uniref:Uncharacterized protein n=1 Tax=Gnathostoma spinigerum TaxID=75299 RepID=A0ABD6EE47_9BILA